MCDHIKVRKLNDALRTTGKGGRIVLTGALVHANEVERMVAAARVQNYTAFTEDNDPYGEHDFGAFTLWGRRYNWKIDYYALDEMHGSPDPADPAVTVRVLSIFYAEDY